MNIMALYLLGTIWVAVVVAVIWVIFVVKRV